LDFARKPGLCLGFLAFLNSGFWCFVILLTVDSLSEESLEPAARRSPGRFVSDVSGGDYQPSPPAGAARGGD
jgi:hypothetical protein